MQRKSSRDWRGTKSKMNPLTTKELDPITVGTCDCCGEKFSETMQPYLKAACHPKLGLQVSYFNGVLTLKCRSCKKLVAHVKVAKN